MEIKFFPTGQEAFAHAKHKARYRHLDHLVIRNQDGTYAAGPVSLELLEYAAETLPWSGKFYRIHSGQGQVATNVGRALADVMIRNARGGMI